MIKHEDGFQRFFITFAKALEKMVLLRIYNDRFSDRVSKEIKSQSKLQFGVRYLH
jgi:hypothetical protein